ncbi:MAG: hypothetical protein Q8Q90_02160 [bacterium]|nr:hypothetical protein [bacterium]
MNNQQITLDQIEQLNQVSDPVARRRFSVLFQLPQDLQNSFESEQTSNSVWDIAKIKYDLADRDVSKVARIIGLIFLGELPIKNFIAELKNKLNIDITKAQAIAQDINQTIFQPVRVSLMQVHGITSENTNTQNTNYKQYAVNQNQQYQASPPQTQQRSQTPPSRNYGAAQQPVKLTPPAYQPNYNDAQKRRDEVLNKIRQQTPPAKPASFYFSRNIRPNNPKKGKMMKRVNKYNSFFT